MPSHSRLTSQHFGITLKTLPFQLALLNVRSLRQFIYQRSGGRGSCLRCVLTKKRQTTGVWSRKLAVWPDMALGDGRLDQRLSAKASGVLMGFTCKSSASGD